MSIRSQLNELINWYDEFAKDPPTEIAVCATANTVRKFAKKKHGVYTYRKYKIVPIRPVRTRDEILMDKHGYTDHRR